MRRVDLGIVPVPLVDMGLADVGAEVVVGSVEGVERLGQVAEGDELEREVLDVDDDLDLRLVQHEACTDCQYTGAGVDVVRDLVVWLFVPELVLDLVATELEQVVAEGDCLVGPPWGGLAVE